MWQVPGLLSLPHDDLLAIHETLPNPCLLDIFSYGHVIFIWVSKGTSQGGFARGVALG